MSFASLEQTAFLDIHPSPSRVIVTGGCGFIGSHQVVALLSAGHDVLVIDNLSNSHRRVLDVVERLARRRPGFAEIDLRDDEALHRLVTDFSPEAVIHFAGKKHVRESVEEPVDYYGNNLGGLLSLVRALKRSSVRKLIFSSSGSVYGETSVLPITEAHPHQPSNPYSATKSIGERILADLCHSDSAWSVGALRYFNPVGAHKSGLLGDDSLSRPSNLLPILMEVAGGLRAEACIYGDDFDSPDGSGVRDYVHVLDVVDAHVRTLDLLEVHGGFTAINIGRGEGVSVLQLISAVEKATGVRIPYRVEPRRVGDVSALYADVTLGKELLGPTCFRSLDEICEDAWRFRVNQGLTEPAELMLHRGGMPPQSTGAPLGRIRP